MSEAQWSLIQTFPSSILYWGKKLYQHRLHRVLFWSLGDYNILNIKIQYRFLMNYYLQSHASSQRRFVVLCTYPAVAVPAARLWEGCACLPTCGTTSSSLFPTPAGSQQTPEHLVYNPPSSCHSHKQHQGAMFAYCVKELWKHVDVYHAL